MSTLKYKATERYSMGWTDPRFETPIKLNQNRKTGFEDVPTEVLRNLWLVKFGGRAVTMNDMHELRGDDIACVGQELADRKLLRYEEHYSADKMEHTNYYILEREDADY